MLQIVEILSSRPRTLFNLEAPTISEGNIADITLFSLTDSWQLNAATNKSKSINNPLWQKQLSGRATAIINKGKLKVLN